MITATFRCAICGVPEEARFVKAFNELIPADEYSEGVMETWDYLEPGDDELLCPSCLSARKDIEDVFRD